MADINIYYSDDYTRSGYEFDTTRKAKWVADSLIDHPISGVRLIEPRPLTAGELALAHDPEYVEAVRTGAPLDLATSSGLGWNSGVFPMVAASSGGAVAAAHDALSNRVNSGSLSSGLHHAARASGNGFCTFNGLALAALDAIDAMARRVLIIDLDAHFGGGTADILGGNPKVSQLDIATSPYDYYTTPRGWAAEWVRDAADYLPTLRRLLASFDSTAFDLVLYNAGMDPYESCLVGGLDGITAEVISQREHTVFKWARDNGLPVAFVLAGGYENKHFGRLSLVALHRLTIAFAARYNGVTP